MKINLHEDQTDFKTLYKNFSKDYNGCIFLQKKIDLLPHFCDIMLIPTILPYFVDIANDVSGNYLAQKIIYHANTKNYKILLDVVSFYFIISNLFY